MEKVSVIIPVYNTEKHLEKCLESIKGQTYENFECILIDDGSVDHSGSICDCFCEKDNRFSVIHQKNYGVSAARNNGLKKASGKYICFVDSDDYVDLHYISNLLCNIRKESVFLSVCCFDFEKRKKDKLFCINKAMSSLFGDRGGIGGYIGGKMFLADIIKNSNLFFDENQALAEDLIFIYKYLALCPHDSLVYFSCNSDYYYVKNENSVLESRNYQTEFNDKWLTILEAYDKLYSVCEDTHIKRQIINGQVMQNVTLIRIMSRCNYKNVQIMRDCKRFILKNITFYMLSANHSLKKRLGALLVVICDKI